MVKVKRKTKKQKGYGLIDYIVNKLPEIHIPGYQYCGPGTDLEKRLARGDPGINPLDRACKDHDIAYSKVQNSKDRRAADKVLVSRAFPRVYSRDAKMGERAAALLTTGLMGAKIGLSKIGLGLKNTRRRRKKSKAHRRKGAKRGGKLDRKQSKRSKKSKRKLITFKKLVRDVKSNIKNSTLQSSSLSNIVKAAIRSAKKLKHNSTPTEPRILKLPRFGGNVLPIVPILSALSAIGSIPASTVAVINAIKKIKQAVYSGEAEKKVGRGLYFMRGARGSGFYLKPYRRH